MHTVTETHSRDEMIAFGNSIGRACKLANRRRPWTILLNGDDASGKSLVALAIDQVFRPEQYPTGIPDEHTINADDKLSGAYPPYQSQSSFKVCFENFGGEMHRTRKSFDAALSEFVNHNRQSAVVIAANVGRIEPHTRYKRFDYAIHGLRSDSLDMHIDVRILRGKFSRRIAITCEDERLVRPLSRLPGASPA